MLPYSNQQVGGTLGGPIIKDKIHYFASYEYEREPGTLFVNPSALPGQTFTIPYHNGQKSTLARVDDQLTRTDRLSIRGSYWTWANPQVLSATTPAAPSTASNQTKNATNVRGTWSRVLNGGNTLLEVKGGYSGFDWHAQFVGEIFNLFNHANYGSYNTSLSPTSAATTALLGTPSQNTGTAYVPREGQVAVRLSF